MAEPKRSDRERELEDMLSDLLDGFKAWRDSKLGHMNWTTQDEMFLRWVEAGPASDEL